MKVTSANGVEGCLLYIHGADKYVFRVYSAPGVFKDYELYHCDLGVKINDGDASFYEHEDGRLILDHSPSTLGLKE